MNIATTTCSVASGNCKYHQNKMQADKAVEFPLQIPATINGQPLYVNRSTIIQQLLANCREEGGEHRSCDADV